MDRERRNGAGRSDERAQLTVDYLVGTVTFLLVIGFVFSFVPEMLVPFTNGQPAHPVVADRTASHLAEDRLAAEPGVLDDDAVEAFFDGADDAADLRDELGVSEPIRVTVTLDGPAERLERGPDPPREFGETTVTRRTVLYDDETCELVVEVW
ncbi:DUF7287 family protein [Halalkalicoccus subterraneus]|uniref:DUF7287 family protein n=1 Tax=Halalkalicoccus subterraneus TaxID=2675002 RepID=UPI0013CF32E2|nr:hypothetical protein [Halalkalicoccus subterraneus]